MASPLCEKPGAGSPHSSLKITIILLCEELSVLSAHVLAMADRVSLQQPPQPQTDGRDGRAGESPESVHHTAHTSLSAATTAIPLFALKVTVSAGLSSVGRTASVWEKLPCNPSYSWRHCQPKSDQYIGVMQTSTPPNYSEPQGQGSDASLQPCVTWKDCGKCCNQKESYCETNSMATSPAPTARNVLCSGDTPCTPAQPLASVPEDFLILPSLQFLSLGVMVSWAATKPLCLLL